MSTPSEDTMQKLAELESCQSSYQPNDAVAARLSRKSLILLVGPSCIGKSTIMDEAVRLDDRFAITGTFTSRERRPDDQGKNYTYIAHTDAGLAPYIRKIAAKEVVQYAVHPTSKLLYGSELAHYAKEYNMLDTLYSAVPAIEKLPARKVMIIGVAAEPEQWLARFDARFPSGHPDRLKRRDEAVQCFDWLLCQPAGKVHWILNGDGGQTEAARQVIDIALGTAPQVEQTDHHGAEIAKAALQAARSLS